MYGDRFPEDIKERFGTHICNPRTVVEVERATLLADTDVKVTREGKYLVYNLGRTSDHRYARTRMAEYFVMELESGRLLPLSPSKYADSPDVDCGISLLNPRGQRNYSHWVAHCLSLLQGAEEYERRTGKKPTVILPDDPPRFVTESLAALGYDESRRVEMTTSRLTVGTLVVPSDPYCDADGFSGALHDVSALEWVRDRIEKGLRLEDSVTSGGDGRRILISRKDTNRRRIVNRDEVIGALKRRGFERVVLSELSFEEQVSLFRDAETVVGVHGAGLVNIVFADGANVLELYGDHFNPEFYEFAELLGHRYACLSCLQQGEDVLVDVEAMNEALDEMGS